MCRFHVSYSLSFPVQETDTSEKEVCLLFILAQFIPCIQEVTCIEQDILNNYKNIRRIPSKYPISIVFCFWGTSLENKHRTVDFSTVYKSGGQKPPQNKIKITYISSIFKKTFYKFNEATSSAKRIEGPCVMLACKQGTFGFFSFGDCRQRNEAYAELSWHCGS